MARRNRDAALLLLRRLVNLVIGRERRAARLRQNLGDRSRQRRLAMVDVTDRPNVAMRLVTLKFCLGNSLCPAIRVLLSDLFVVDLSVVVVSLSTSGAAALISATSRHRNQSAVLALSCLLRRASWSG